MKINSAFILSLMLAGTSATALAQDALPKVYGSVVFGRGWEDMGEDAPHGVYALPADNGDGIALVQRDNRLFADGGGVYVDGRYYLTDYSSFSTDGTISFRAFDVTGGWSLLYERTLTDLSSIASDLAYDPVSDRIYGCFSDSEGSGNYFFGTLDPLTGRSTKIADLKEELLVVACNRLGQVYGVGAYGMLYAVDKQSGALTEIGQTGKSIKYAQSATFDYASGRLLWAMTPHYTDQEAELCEVSTTTGAVTTLTTIPNRYELTGIYTETSYALGTAPAVPSQLAANFTKDALTGSLSFSMPATSYSGGTLTDAQLSYEVKIDGQQAATASASAGAQVNVSQTLTRGMHYAKVAASNASGRSPYTMLDFWVGMDEAQAGNAQAALTAAGDVLVSWTAPTKGVHDGYIDTAGMTYKVVRMPDQVVVYEGKQTSCTDAAAASLSYNNYTYAISVVIGGEEGPSVTTAALALGEALKLPYLQSFDDANAVATMTIEDANEDDNTWSFWDGGMTYGLSEQGLDGDDWLITPAFSLSTDSVYQVSIDASADQGYSERMAIMAGTEAKGASLTQEVLPVTTVANEQYETYTAMFRPEQNGKCHIGVHAVSTYDDGSFLYVDNLAVDVLASIHAPSAVTQAVASAQGAERLVSLSFTAPTTDIEGKSLSEITQITVRRTSDDTLIQTFTDVQPGQSVSLTDTPSTDGMTTYAITASNSHGAGLVRTLQVYVGYDVPSTVGDVRLTATDDGLVTLSWSAPTVGKNGGTVNQSGMKYIIGNVGGASSKTATTTETTYTEQLTLTEGSQKLAWYSITPQNAQGKGTAAQTDTVAVGKPYTLPYAESFASRSLDKGPWYTVNSDVAEWNLMQFGTYANAADDDNGLISFSTITAGAQARFVGPKVVLSGASNPQLSLYTFQMKNSTHSVRIALRTDDGTEHVLDEFCPRQSEGEDSQGEWMRSTYDLSGYRDAAYVQLVLTGTGGQADDWASIRPLYVDQIAITDPVPENLALGEVGTPNDHVCVGEEVTIDAEVKNKGVSAVSGYTLRLLRDGVCVDSIAGREIAADEADVFVLKDAPNASANETSRYRVQIDLPTDGDQTDNESADIIVTVRPGLPFVDRLTASADGEGSSLPVKLTWTEPQDCRGAEAADVTEDFESYAAFTIRHFGQWTLYDGDRQTTMGIQDGHGDFVQYDNVEAPMAFMVFNPSQVSLSSFYYPVHSGKQVAAAFNAGRYVANDDWLISPEVDGAQTITFYACSPDASYYGTNESLEVLYSTTDTVTTSFTKVGQTITVPGAWTQYSAELPAGTKHFALRCTSLDQYILFLDDISYRRAARELTLTGFNIYRDGQLLAFKAGNAEASTAAMSYTDEQGSTSSAYSITAVYEQGESRTTAATWTSVTSIDLTTLDGQQAPTAVYDLSGRRLPTANRPGPGIYIVRQGTTTRKISVK